MTPGIKQTGNYEITAAGTQTGTEVASLEDMSRVTFYAKFDYGSGGTETRVYLMTSFDQGNTWVDIACLLFAQADETLAVTIVDEKVATPVDLTAALSDDTCRQFLGDRLKTRVVSTGTYAGATTLVTRAQVR